MAEVDINIEYTRPQLHNMSVETSIAPWRKNCLENKCWIRSDYTTLSYLNTAHRAEILDMNAWYWTEEDTDHERWLCFGFRVSHDKDNYAFSDPHYPEFEPYNSVKYESKINPDRADGRWDDMEDEVHQIWLAIDGIDNGEKDSKDEGGYLEIRYDKASGKASSSAKFGTIER
jgi:hypothetical protein